MNPRDLAGNAEEKRERKIQGSIPTWPRGVFFRVESYHLPKNWHSSSYPVSAWTGWPGVSILWLGEMESSISNFYFSVAARTTAWVDPSLRYTGMLLGR